MIISGILGLFTIVCKSLRQHVVSTIITAISIALACGLVMSVFVINEQAKTAFRGGSVDFDAVLGAKGSQLQLVLNSVFHLETSPGNIPWSLYQAIKKDKRIKLAVPYAVGDNYFGYRLVGTTKDIFISLKLKAGRRFKADVREAVVGSFVAQKTGLKVGSRISPFHGLAFNKNSQHQEVYEIVGVLKPSNTPSDRVIWIPIESFYRMGGHVLRGKKGSKPYAAEEGKEIPDEYKEVSAVMLKLKSKIWLLNLDRQINGGKVATFAPIVRTISSFMGKMGWIIKILKYIAYLVILVAAASIVASIYNSINERKRNFAIFRALGARKSTVFSAIILESASIAGIGALFGFLVYIGIFSVAALLIRSETGVVMDFTYHLSLILTPIGSMLIGAIAGVIPAVKAYSTDVASHLSPTT